MALIKPNNNTLSAITELPSGISGQNYPAFYAVMSDNQTVSEGTTTLIQFDTVTFDTDNAFNNTGTGNGYSFTVPSGQDGKYVIYTSLQVGGGTSNVEFLYVFLYVNGSNTLGGRILVDCRDNEQSQLVPYRNVVVQLSAGDYVQIYFQMGTANGGDVTLNDGTSTRKDTIFGGYRIGD